MDKIKEPAMLVGSAALTLSVGNSVYFYKQLEAFRADLGTISTTLSSLGHKVAEMAKGDQNRNEALHTLSDQIKTINQRMDQLPSFETIDQIHTDFDDLTAALQEHNIEVVLSPHPSTHPSTHPMAYPSAHSSAQSYQPAGTARPRAGSRTGQGAYGGHGGQGSHGASRARVPAGPRYPSDREEEIRAPRTPSHTRDEWGRTGSSRDYSSRRPSVAARADHGIQDQYRDPPRSQHQAQLHPLPEEDAEDDTDLIDLVRRQQPRN